MEKLKTTLITATITAVILMAVPPSAGAGDVYKKMANDIARYSSRKNVKNLAVLGFARKARTSREESEYVSEKLLSCLVASGKVNLLERSQLGKVLEERRLAAAGVTEDEDKESKINPSDAIIVGTIFGTKSHLMIIAKMIDPLTGAVLHTVEAEADRQLGMMPSGFDFDVPDLREIADMFREEEVRPDLSLADFRDAPASLDTETCNARKTRLAAMQRTAVEAKAKYWALRMREPGFSSRKLTRNPGGEIRDRQVRSRFYARLRDFHRAPSVPELSVPEMNAVIVLMKEEKRIADDCGLH